MITEDYVSFEIAKLLKEKGFDEPTIGSYTLTDKLTYIGKFTEEEVRRNWSKGYNNAFVSAPTHQMALKWLRKTHKLFIHIDVIREASYWTADIQDIGNDVDRWVVEKGFKSYEEAVEGAIEYCLINLI